MGWGNSCDHVLMMLRRPQPQTSKPGAPGCGSRVLGAAESRHLFRTRTSPRGYERERGQRGRAAPTLKAMLLNAVLRGPHTHTQSPCSTSRSTALRQVRSWPHSAPAQLQACQSGLRHARGNAGHVFCSFTAGCKRARGLGAIRAEGVPWRFPSKGCLLGRAFRFQGSDSPCGVLEDITQEGMLSHHMRASLISSPSSALRVSFDTHSPLRGIQTPIGQTLSVGSAIEWPLSCKPHRVAFRMVTTPLLRMCPAQLRREMRHPTQLSATSPRGSRESTREHSSTPAPPLSEAVCGRRLTQTHVCADGWMLGRHPTTPTSCGAG